MNPAGSRESLEVRSDSEAHTQAVGAAIGRLLSPGDVVALEGELGAGKTCFVRGLAEGLGIPVEQVSSPTFTICQEYSGSRASPEDGPGRGRPIVLAHVDAYRLSGAEELETIGWPELIDSDDVVIAVEWPSRIADAIPPEAIRVELAHEGRSSRAIRIAARTDMIESLRGLRFADAAESACRTCGKPMRPDAATFPFCSPRCRLADLGKWFNEGYRTTRPVEADDELNE